MRMINANMINEDVMDAEEAESAAISAIEFI